MLTTMFIGNRVMAISPSLEVFLSVFDDRLLQDMGLLRDPANRLMRAPVEFNPADMTKSEGSQAA